MTPLGWLKRMTQFKEKSRKNRENLNAGLLNYPVLMAADILLYETDLVPVGEDQKQHLEFTRDIAQHFNSIYGGIFKMPEPAIAYTGTRIMALDDPRRKMSKSDPNPNQAINLLDSTEDIRSKIMKAKTDSLREIRFNENQPGIHNLLVIYEGFTGLERKVIEARFDGKGYGDFKQALSEVIIDGLKPLRSRYHRLMREPEYVEKVLREGAERVRPIAEKVLHRVKKRTGLL